MDPQKLFLIINTISCILAIVPWGMFPDGNIPLQKFGIGVQITGLIMMLSNFAAFFLL